MARSTPPPDRAEDGRPSSQSKRAREGSPTCGQLLQRFRHAARLTQEELAERSGYSANYISKLERDQRQPPVQALDHLATLLGLSHEDHQALLDTRARRREIPAPSAPGTPPLAGRTDELSQIKRFLAGQRPPVLLFSGELGIGKSRLIEEGISLARLGGWTILRGSCQRPAMDPYAPLSEALARSVQALSPAARDAVLAECAWLGLLLPELTTPTPAFSPPLEQRHRLLCVALARYLRAVADTGSKVGVLLALDDLQWAGADALALLAALLHREANGAGTPPIRLLGAYRDTDVAPDAPLAVLVADLAREGQIAVVPLSPLGELDAAQLLDALVAVAGDEALRAQLPAVLRRCGGVPFFLVSYVEHLAEHLAEHLRAYPRTPAPSLDLPWAVTQVIKQRVVALPHDVQDVLTTAALIGDPVPRALLTQATGLSEETVLAALDAATGVRLIEEAGAGAYRFPHEVVRETTESMLSSGRRQLVHRRIGEALERESNSSIEALSYHFAHSDDHARAARYLEGAGDLAHARCAHAAAASFYREALARQEGQQSTARGSLQEKLGLALYTVGQYEEALAAFERAAEHFRAVGDREGESRALGRQAETHYRRGTGHLVLAQVEALVSGDDPRLDATTPGAVAIYQGLFRLLFAAGAYPQLLHTARRLGEAGRSRGNPVAALVGELGEGAALIQLGNIDAGVKLLEAALPRASALEGDERVAELSLLLGCVYLVQGAFERARALAEQALRAATALNDPVLMAVHMTIVGMVHHFLGAWGAARDALERADALFAASGPSLFAAQLIPIRVLAEIHEGNWGSARQRLVAMSGGTGGITPLTTTRRTAMLLAELDLREGHPRDALARLQAVDTGDLQWSDGAQVLATLAWAQLAVGEMARAAEMAERAVSLARQWGAWVQGITALRVRGMIAGRLGQHELAAASFAEGLERARSLPFSYAEAQLLLEEGVLDYEQGRAMSARDKLEQALALFDRLGASKESERTRTALVTISDLPAGERMGAGVLQQRR